MFITISRYLFLLFLIKSCLHLFPQHNDTFFERGPQPNKIGNNQIFNRRILDGSELNDCDRWSEWSPCSKTCDIGIKIRARISNNPIHSLFCSKFTESSVCFMQECPESSERRSRDEREKRKNKKSKMLTKYLIIFCVFSAANIIILLICAIISIKKKLI
ncbi:thrombospondin related sporozoite protein, putative [Plasmodium chabaudi chabaudi]|uniref:Thrombospondin related sporozoite protein, putative n=1 Tax=Plasmodium chabaudi chabaudi TaxID=31271 RepID=A0A1D3LAS6_PLACU|nr:thrombospondin related sporozoite protein, putative [Plasmodium chabaudi chabaudi]